MRIHVVPAAFAALALTASMLLGALAQSPKAKPRVPPGVDPGGVAVAVIGSGIDYTRPEIAARLARDGEGQIIGWDFLDNDRLPFDACREPASACTVLKLSPLLQRASPSRVIVVRASSEQPQTMVAAVRMIAATPARVVLVAFDRPVPLQFLREAAAHYPELVFVGAAAFVPTDGKEAILGNRNLLAVRTEAGAAIAAAISASATLAYNAGRCIGESAKADAAAVAQCARKSP